LISGSGDIPHQNSVKVIGVKLFLNAYLNNLGAAHPPTPGGILFQLKSMKIFFSNGMYITIRRNKIRW